VTPPWVHRRPESGIPRLQPWGGFNYFESESAEAARLAESPIRSINHELSNLPVTMHGWPEKKLIMLPRLNDTAYTVVVLPYRFHAGTEEAQRINRDRPNGQKRREGSWDCIVVQSDHPSYAVGGYDLCLSAVEISRGRKVETSFNYDRSFSQYKAHRSRLNARLG